MFTVAQFHVFYRSFQISPKALSFPAMAGFITQHTLSRLPLGHVGLDVELSPTNNQNIFTYSCFVLSLAYTDD